MPFVNPGDLVMVTESLSVPTATSVEYVPLKADVPEGTIGVITADRGGGIYSLVTGLGLIQVHTRHLKRLGKAIPEWMESEPKH